MLVLNSVLTQLNLTEVRALETFTQIADSDVRRQAARALIMLHHQRLGGLGGPIGIEMDDVQPLGNGFMKPYSAGFIELLDFANGPGPQGFESKRAEVRFVGFRCHQDSDEALIGDGDGDEPYFIIGIVGSNADKNLIKTTKIFDHIFTGTNKSIGEMVTTNAQPPFTLTITAMDHDSGSPEEASAKVQKSLNDAAAKISLALAVVGAAPGVAAIGGVVQSMLNIFGDWIGDAASALFGMGDDFIGQNFSQCFDLSLETKEWLTPKRLPSNGFEEDKPFNVELVLADGEGGRYSAFFQVSLFTDFVVPVAVEK